MTYARLQSVAVALIVCCLAAACAQLPDTAYGKVEQFKAWKE